MSATNHRIELPLGNPTGDQPVGIIHYRLLIDPTRDNDLVFTCKKVQVSNKPGDIETLAQAVAGGHPMFPEERDGASPYDMAAKRPCWIIVELDPTKKGWQFDSSEKAISFKAGAAVKLYGLKHVRPGEKPSEPSPGEGCRVVYFGVANRDASGSAINLHTEFVQGDKRLKIIIDPDVPNTGDDPP
jgi:hypothetical protein